MTLHLNDYGLQQQGFRLIAQYECFSKGERSLNIKCYKNGTAYLVRDFLTRGRAWDEVFEDRDSANEYVKKLWSKRKFHKRVF